MIKVEYAPKFVRKLKKLPVGLQDEALEKIEVFKNKKNHKQLKVHKLQGRFDDCFSFSVNYQTRIVFMYLKKDYVTLLTVGDHDIYK